MPSRKFSVSRSRSRSRSDRGSKRSRKSRSKSAAAGAASRSRSPSRHSGDGSQSRSRSRSRRHRSKKRRRKHGKHRSSKKSRRGKSQDQSSGDDPDDYDPQAPIGSSFQDGRGQPRPFQPNGSHPRGGGRGGFRGGRGGFGGHNGGPPGRFGPPGPHGQVMNADQERRNALYKTRLCMTFMSNGHCNYGFKCQFAHGQHELRAVSTPAKFKEEFCSNLLNKGACPFGDNCRFVHGNETEEMIAKSSNPARCAQIVVEAKQRGLAPPRIDPPAARCRPYNPDVIRTLKIQAEMPQGTLKLEPQQVPPPGAAGGPPNPQAATIATLEAQNSQFKDQVEMLHQANLKLQEENEALKKELQQAKSEADIFAVI